MTRTARERRADRTRDAILKAAGEIIAKKGTDGLSIREIARRIDYSPAGLYEYFGSKDEIVTSLCQQFNDTFFAALAAVPDDLPPTHYLVELGMAYIQFARQNPELFILMFNQLNVGVVEMPKESTPDSAFDLVTRGVERGIANGDIAQREDYNVMDIAYGLWSLVHGTAMLQINYMADMRYDFEASDRHAIETFVRGLR